MWCPKYQVSVRIKNTLKTSEVLFAWATVVAVSVGATVLFYRNMKPYYKWTLPSLPIDETEQDIWRKLPTDKVENIPMLVDRLRTLDEKVLTQVSLELMQKPVNEMDVGIQKTTYCT